MTSPAPARRIRQCRSRSIPRNDGLMRDGRARANRPRVGPSGLPPARRRWNAGRAVHPRAPTRVRRRSANAAKACRATARCRTPKTPRHRCRPDRNSSGCHVFQRATTVPRSPPAARRAALDAGAPQEAATTRAAAVAVAARAAWVEVRTAARAAGPPQAAGVNAAGVGARTALPRLPVVAPKQANRRPAMADRAEPNSGSPADARPHWRAMPRARVMSRALTMPRARVMARVRPNRRAASPHRLCLGPLGRFDASAHPDRLPAPHVPRWPGVTWKPDTRRRAGMRTPAGNHPRPAAAAEAPVAPRARR